MVRDEAEEQMLKGIFDEKDQCHDEMLNRIDKVWKCYMSVKSNQDIATDSKHLRSMYSQIEKLKEAYIDYIDYVR